MDLYKNNNLQVPLRMLLTSLHKLLKSKYHFGYTPLISQSCLRRLPSASALSMWNKGSPPLSKTHDQQSPSIVPYYSTLTLKCIYPMIISSNSEYSSTGTLAEVTFHCENYALIKTPKLPLIPTQSK